MNACFVTCRCPSATARARPGGFSLIELLVVIAIMALLAGLLLPALQRAGLKAKSCASLSNLRQLALGMALYRDEHGGRFPVHAWPAVPGQARVRWPDLIFPYVPNPRVYLSPALRPDEWPRMNKPFAHTAPGGIEVEGVTQYFGGYGYNYQYLGNGRQPGGVPPFHATDSAILAAARTVMLGDTKGARGGRPDEPYGVGGSGVYALDPPLGSLALGSQGSRRISAVPGPGNAYYEGGSDGSDAHRATPSDRNGGRVNVVMVDGHAAAMTPGELDGRQRGVETRPNNAWWNGRFDPDLR